ncbi:hypothetical protein GUJ93_ZPchr0012g20989 [Zizania palustris]|uniref:RPAP1 N-terminal domain-containing protein n=1 Tax=Zizania palustris TaxID=103762 RepID=A0A8J5WNF7_ZIZPA|nr:hypothetical protein GUJ93_ZPchr0012g20989 [Zizania palustris]
MLSVLKSCFYSLVLYPERRFDLKLALSQKPEKQRWRQADRQEQTINSIISPHKPYSSPPPVGRRHAATASCLTKTPGPPAMSDATERRRQPGAHPERRRVVEEPFDPSPPPAAAAAAAPPSHLVGAIVEKGFSSLVAAPSSAPSPTVLPFPVARHRSHGPHWIPAARDAGLGEVEDEEEGMDLDETDYQPVAAVASPVRRKEKKGMDFTRWRELVTDDAPPKRRQAKPLQPKKERKGFRGTDMWLEIGNEKSELGEVALISDLASRKPIIQVDARDVMRNVSHAGDAELQGEGMNLDSGEPSLSAEINAENMSRLAGMSAGEIAEAQAEILNRMNPSLVEMLKRRGRRKPESRKDGGKGKGGEISGPGKTLRAMPVETAGEHSGHSWKAWSQRVERIRSCRFTLDGDIWGFNLVRSSKMARKHTRKA